MSMLMNMRSRKQVWAVAFGLSTLAACMDDSASIPDSAVDGTVNSPSVETWAGGWENACLHGFCDAGDGEHGDGQGECIRGPGQDCEREPAHRVRSAASRRLVRSRREPAQVQVQDGPRCTMAELDQARADVAATRDELAQVHASCVQVDHRMQVARRRAQSQARAVKLANTRNAEMAETLHMFLGRNIELSHENERLRDALDGARQENERLLRRLHRIRSGELQ